MKTNKKTLNPKTVGRNVVLVFCAFASVFTLAVLASCDTEPKPATCTCPNGTEHLPGQSCCDNSDCTCIKVPGTTSTVEGKATTGIPITNRGNLVDSNTFATIVSNVNTALNHTQISSATQQAYIKANIKEIRVEKGTADPSISNGVLIVKDENFGSIRSALYAWLNGLEITMLFKQMDNSKNTVRMTFRKVMGQRMI